MSGHLTERQLSACLAGSAAARENAHLATCPTCLEALADRRLELTSFQSSVKAWSDDAFQKLPHAPRPMVAAPRSPWRMRIPVYAAALGLCLSAAVVSYSHRGGPTQRAVPSPEADSLLLDEVERSVSRHVAAGMAPLGDLVVADQRNLFKDSSE